MANSKLILDDDFSEEFSLLAIHCSEEAFKIAYLLNKFAMLHLKRRQIDLEYSNDGLEITFPLFVFENEMQYTTYHLIANKCKSVAAHLLSSGGLFDDDNSENTITTHLLPEFKKVDYFLKIHSELEIIPIRKIVASINEIKQVISAYEIDVDQIKSKNNLIFD